MVNVELMGHLGVVTARVCNSQEIVTLQRHLGEMSPKTLSIGLFSHFAMAEISGIKSTSGSLNRYMPGKCRCRGKEVAESMGIGPPLATGRF